MDYKFLIKRSNRKTLCVEITPRGEVLIRAPYRAADYQIRRFLDERIGWIEKHLKEREDYLLSHPMAERFSMEELNELANRALEVIPPKVQSYAKLLGVSYGKITIRNQRTRWGSCSAKGNLNFNCLLMLAPEDVLDYVIVHELSHRIEMNHSKRFWNVVSGVMPDYKAKIKWLKEHGEELMARIT